MNAMPANSPSRSAFTILDALTLLITLGLLAAVAGAMLVRAGARAEAILCISNFKQFMMAEHLYSGDSDGQLLAAFPGGNPPGFLPPHNPMAPGTCLDWTTAPINTNGIPLGLDVPTGHGYQVGLASARWRCPADRHVSPAQRSVGWTHRARSVARNALIGPGNPEVGIYYRPLRDTDLRIPGPARTWFWLDEHPDSINDFVFLPPMSSRDFADTPSPCHRGAGGFGFADGHGETHRWTGPVMTGPLRKVTFNSRSQVTTPTVDQDLLWLGERCPRVSERTY